MTFRELRKQKNTAVKELKASIHLLQLKREENTRLKEVIDMNNQIISRLHQELLDETKAKNRIEHKLSITKKCRDRFYSRWLKDHSKIRNWKKLCSFITIVSIATIIALAIN
jgi:uncharacterized protein YhaN